MHQSTITTPGAKPAASNRNLLLLGSGVGLVVIVVVVWAIIHSMGGAEPRLNEPTPVLAKFVASRQFDQMPYDKQRLYYKMLDDRGKEIDQAHQDKHLTDSEYQSAVDAAWLGKHINRVEKYFGLPTTAAKNEYVNQLVTKKLKKEAEQQAKKQKQRTNTEDKLDADEAAAELRVESWPPQVQAQWKQFHEAYKREKKAREEATKSAEK